MFIAIDTSIGTSIDLFAADTSHIAHFYDENPRGHLESIHSGIDKCIKAAKAYGAQIETVVCGVGPGPFAALRVGVSAARTLAFAHAAAFVPVGTHFAAAQEYVTQLRGEVLDERRILIVANKLGRGTFAASSYTLLSVQGKNTWVPNTPCDSFKRLKEQELQIYAQELGAALFVPDCIHGAHLLGAYNTVCAMQDLPKSAYYKTPNKILYPKRK